MNRTKRSFAIALLTLMFSQATLADGWTNELMVTSVTQQPNSDVITVETNLASNVNGCGSLGTGFYFTVASTDERSKRLYASLIAAHLASRPVRIHFSSTCYPGVGWYHALMGGIIVE